MHAVHGGRLLVGSRWGIDVHVVVFGCLPELPYLLILDQLYMFLRGLHFPRSCSNIWRVIRIIIKTHNLRSTVLNDLIIAKVRILRLR